MHIEFWGDSLTKGEISAPIISPLKEHLQRHQFEVSIGNFGVNGRRFRDLNDSLLSKNPSPFRILWLGTNDIWQNRPFKESIPILKACRNRWGLRLLVMSPPPIGEDPTHSLYAHWKTYCHKLELICSDLNIPYLSLVELFDREIKKKPSFYKRYGFGIEIGIAVFRRLCLRQTWNNIGQRRGLHWHTDQIHLNENAIQLIIENKLGPFLQKELSQYSTRTSQGEAHL